MLSLHLQGGFGEKGRTSVAVSDGSSRVILDAGIKVGATGDGYYPQLLVGLAEINGLLVSHAHEDHVGALCRLNALGYAGPIFMTAETRSEMEGTLQQYADPRDLDRLQALQRQIETFEPGETLRLGSLQIESGHSGHVAGGVWFAVSSEGQKVIYAADMVSHSAVFRMDDLPDADLAILDASYGADPVPTSERARQITEWIAARPEGCLLPTPLSGRSLELMAVLTVPFAIESRMRPALLEQIGASAVRPELAARLRERLGSASDWTVGDPLPARPLLVHDGMGVAGPAKAAMRQAVEAGFPILLTGHLPAGSYGELLAEEGRADWIRMPTHPTLPDNVELWRRLGKPPVLGHSCDPGTLCQLREHIPTLDTGARTGQTYVIERK